MDTTEENGTAPVEELDEAALAALEEALGYRFQDPELLVTALRHRSYVHQLRAGPGLAVDDNQRFEFLGDAVLSLCVSTLLFERFTAEQEGELSRMRAGLVREGGLAEMARRIDLGPAILLGRGEEATGGREKSSILADALEALMSAVYLDGGFEAAMDVTKRLWGEMIVRSSKDDFLKDFKTRLQEETQALMGLAPEYRLLGSEGPDHALTFEVGLNLAGREVARAKGRSKKDAEQAAARKGLEALRSGEFDDFA